MKVLHIINSLNFGGAEKLLVDTLPKFNNEHVEAELLILKHNKTPFYKTLIDNNVIIVTLSNKLSIYNPYNIFKIIPHLKKFEIVHVHLFPALYWVAIANLFISKKPKLVLTEHNTENRRRHNLILKITDKYIYKAYTKIIAISNATKTNLEKHLGGNLDKIITINNGIDLNKIIKAIPYKHKDLNLPDNAKIIIQVSSFTNQKDQNTLIRAMLNLPKHMHLLLVGDGPQKKTSVELAKTLKIENNVHFLGYRSDVPELVKTAHISVLSSHYEGFGLAIVEGMAANNACVASNVAGLSEIISDCGILFNPGDSNKLNEILLQLDSDNILYSKIANQCLKKAEMYNIEAMINSQIKLYKSLIN
jgi:glycosyltransferase involved in cell wall biosynthesis